MSIDLVEIRTKGLPAIKVYDEKGVEGNKNFVIQQQSPTQSWAVEVIRFNPSQAKRLIKDLTRRLDKL